VWLVSPALVAEQADVARRISGFHPRRG
jgi:hypothetical protein